jgi:hypothetical protein
MGGSAGINCFGECGILAEKEILYKSSTKRIKLTDENSAVQ